MCVCGVYMEMRGEGREGKGRQAGAVTVIIVSCLGLALALC